MCPKKLSVNISISLDQTINLMDHIVDHIVVLIFFFLNRNFKIYGNIFCNYFFLKIVNPEIIQSDYEYLINCCCILHCT